MSYIGQQPVTGDNNSFRILDSISSYTQTFDGSSSAVVSTANSTLTFTGHRFITGQRVTYSTTGTTIGGLSSGSVYYVIKTDQNTLKLASSYVNALASTSITLTSLGVGSTHTLNVAFDSVNTKFKATFNNGTKGLITRAAQLNISINGVIQEPQDTTTPSTGFGIEADSTIVFSTPPVVSDVFWGSLVATNFATFDISDNTVDSFTGDGSQVNFALSKTPANNQNVLVTINGVVQYPSDATNVRAYSVSGNVLIFVGAPGNGSLIQVRHIGFAGATSSSVTGFYGRTGNVGLTTADTVSIGAATIGTGGIGTSLLVQGNARITGILTIGTGSITLDGNANTISGVINTNATGVSTVGSLSIGATSIISAGRQLQNIASLDATTTATIESAVANAPNTFTDLSVTGISTLGVTSATNLTAQSLSVSGIVTAASFSGTATSTTNIPNLTGAITSVNTVTSLGSFTSANLATALSDETGSGANVFATSPVLVTPSLGIATAQSLVVSGISTLGITTATNLTAQSLVVSGITTVSAGTTALPSISPSGDSNTGIFFPAADTIAASTGGTSRITIDSSGNITVTNNLIIPLGTSLLPSLAFLSDPNTGLFSPGADTLALVTGGTNRLHITSAGLVGIGITSPSGLIDAQQSSSGANVAFRFRNTATTAGSTTTIDLSEDGAGRSVWRYSPNTGDTFFGSVDAGNYNLRLYTNTNERARIRNDGTFEIKGAGTAGSSPGFSVNPSTPANSFVIDSSGRLGIGISSPTAIFHAVASSSSGTTNADGIRINAGGNVAINMGANSSVGYGWIQSANWGSGYVATAINPNGGNVGIGTISPGSLLHVAGKIRFGSNATYYGEIDHDSASTGSNIYDHSDSGGHIFRKNGTEQLRIDSSARLLVGTSSELPVYYNSASTWNGLLQVARSAQDAVANLSIWNNSASTYATYGGAQIHLSACKSGTVGSHTSGALASGDSIATINFNASDGTNFRNSARIEAVVDGGVSTGDVPGRLVFSTTADGAASPTEKMRISSTGNMGIGTGNDPGYKLGIIATTTATPSLSLRSNAAGDVGTAQLRIIKADATSTTSQIFIQFVIDGNNVNSGQINANGASQAAFGSFSDVRLKENIENLPSQINNIKALRPVEFDYKDKSGHQIGFVAQEMEQIYPDAIGIGENEMLTVTGWSKTEARLVKALQEAIAKIETLEQRLTAAGID